MTFFIFKPTYMRFFSKLVVIWNWCFITSVILRLWENANKIKGDFTGLIKLQPLESTLVVLGYTAIFVNFVFCLAILLLFAIKRKHGVAKWIIWFNFLLLIFQIYYFLFSNF